MRYTHLQGILKILRSIRMFLATNKAVLMRQVGDLRQCPHCGGVFIPDDDTAKHAWTAVETTDTIDGILQRIEESEKNKVDL